MSGEAKPPFQPLGHPQHRPPPGWGIPEHLKRGYSPAYRAVSTPTKLIPTSVTLVKKYVPPQQRSSPSDRVEGGVTLGNENPTSTPRFNVFTDWAKADNKSRDDNQKVNKTIEESPAARDTFGPPLTASRWAQPARHKLSANAGVFSSQFNKTSAASQKTMADSSWGATALETPANNQAQFPPLNHDQTYPIARQNHIPGNERASVVNSNGWERRGWNNASNSNWPTPSRQQPPNGRSFRAPSQTSSRGRRGSRNANRPSLVPSSVINVQSHLDAAQAQQKPQNANGWPKMSSRNPSGNNESANDWSQQAAQNGWNQQAYQNDWTLHCTQQPMQDDWTNANDWTQPSNDNQSASWTQQPYPPNNPSDWTPQPQQEPQPDGWEKDSRQYDRRSTRSSGGKKSFAQNMRADRRRTKWATNAEVKAPPKPSSSVEQERDDDKIDVASDLADGGHGVQKLKRLIEPGQDASLDIRDFDGSWAPVPADWEERPMFTGYPSAKKIEEWDDGYDGLVTSVVYIPFTEIEIEVRSRYVQLPGEGDPVDFVAGTGEICPQDWIIDELDGSETTGGMKPFNEFWKDLQKMPGEPKDTDDNIKMYWERTSGWGHNQLTPLRVPDATVDPSDNDLSKAKTQCSTFNIMQKGNAKLQRNHDIKKEKKEAIRRQKEMENYVPTPNKYSPRCNIYLRPVELGDVSSMLELYNYWIENSVYAAEMTPMSQGDFYNRVSGALDENLPWIVAVDRSASKKLPPRARMNRQQPRQDHVVGFVMADDYHSKESMFRYTLEVECYVRPAFLRKGVGQTLMDKMISVLDVGYTPVEGYEFVCEDESVKYKYTNGGSRLVDQFIIQVSHGSEDKGKLQWNGNWLIERWGFKKVGYLEDIGRKLNSKVSVAFLAYTTATDVPKNAP